jgi:hypothetical protein
VSLHSNHFDYSAFYTKVQNCGNEVYCQLIIVAYFKTLVSIEYIIVKTLQNYRFFIAITTIFTCSSFSFQFVKPWLCYLHLSFILMQCPLDVSPLSNAIFTIIQQDTCSEQKSWKLFLFFLDAHASFMVIGSVTLCSTDVVIYNWCFFLIFFKCL